MTAVVQSDLHISEQTELGNQMDSTAVGALCLDQDEFRVLHNKALLFVVLDVGHLLFFACLSVAGTELRERISGKIDAFDCVGLIVVSIYRS
jgi:hypothetical protein